MSLGESSSRISNYEALQRARDAVERALNASDRDDALTWGSQLQSATHSLFDALEAHRRASEAPAGTLAEMENLKPALNRQLERQRREHAEMLRRAEELEADVERGLAFQEVDVELWSLEARILVDGLRAHLIRAAQLFYAVYFQEEGGENG